MVSQRSERTQYQPESLRRITRFKWIVGLGLAVSFLLAPGIWLERQFFTPMPIADAFRPLPPPLDLVVLVALLALLGAALVANRPRPLIFAWVTLFALRTLWDQATWQPFILMYAFFLFTIAFAAWDGQPRDRDRNSAVLNTSRFIVVAIYIWSGFSKLSFGFVHYVLPELLQAAGVALPTELIVRIGLLFPLAEIAIALGLLLPRTRPLCLAAAIVMHAFVLLAVGPFGQNYNTIVWPWNVAMIAILLVLFRGARDVSPRAILLNRGFPLHLVAVALFGLLPGFSYLGLWPTYLSFRLYSDQYHWATISLTPAVRLKLPPRSRDEVMIGDDYGGYDGHLNVAYWSEHELGAIIPPEPSVFSEVARRVCALADHPLDVRLIITAPPDRWSGEETRTTRYCDAR
jgi:hypothetical protein